MRKILFIAAMLTMSSTVSATRHRTLDSVLSDDKLPASVRAAPDTLRISPSLDANLSSIMAESDVDSMERGFCISIDAAKDSPGDRHTNYSNKSERRLVSSNITIGDSGSIKLDCIKQNYIADVHTHPGGSTFVPSYNDFHSRTDNSNFRGFLVIGSDHRTSIVLNTLETLDAKPMGTEKIHSTAMMISQIISRHGDDLASSVLELALLCTIKKQACYYRNPGELYFHKVGFSESFSNVVKPYPSGSIRSTKIAMEMYYSWAVNRKILRPDEIKLDQPMDELIQKLISAPVATPISRSKELSPYSIDGSWVSYGQGQGFSKDYLSWETFHFSPVFVFKRNEKGEMIDRPELSRALCVQYGIREFIEAGKDTIKFYASVVFVRMGYAHLQTICWSIATNKVIVDITQKMQKGKLDSQFILSNGAVLNRSDDYQSICENGILKGNNPSDCKSNYNKLTNIQIDDETFKH